jgi:imidazole glycerol-phosphate synthase subunit HisH
MISVIDYGAGNLRSITNALKKIGADVDVVTDKLSNADAIVLPGVGNFGDAMVGLKPIEQNLLERLESGTPFLGLCLGLQVLFSGSEEAKKTKGLGLISEQCLRFDDKICGKVPHMGWNQVSQMKGPLFDGIDDYENFYFVHSYYCPIVERTSAICNYGIEFCAAVEMDNIFACQFHPERSGESGLHVLKNFLDVVRK